MIVLHEPARRHGQDIAIFKADCMPSAHFLLATHLDLGASHASIRLPLRRVHS